MSDLIERTKSHTFKEFTIFKGVIEGTIEGFKRRFCIMSRDHWKVFYSSMYDLLGKSTNAILRKIGEDFGQKLYASIENQFKTEPKTTFLFILQELEKLGWGAFWNIRINTDSKEIEVELHNSIEVYKEGIPSCYHVYGILKGLAKSILGEDIVIREIECTAKGDKICKFIIGTKTVVPELYPKETIEKLINILQELKKTIKSSVELVATTDGRPIITNLSEEIDSSLWTTNLSFILEGGKNSSHTIKNGDLKEIIINAEKGIIITSQVTKDIIIAVVVGSDTSPGLAGLALKKAKDKIIELLK
ncbi:MAG TPA: V4R domain-containing protein [Candidatus Deferrimicrobium sp.]|nr:V4R domain-containing protein [Candidatus Deferrimicrobium sp.]